MISLVRRRLANANFNQLMPRPNFAVADAKLNLIRLVGRHFDSFIALGIKTESDFNVSTVLGIDEFRL